jgi:membrane protein DedA with SNARE-associated domain
MSSYEYMVLFALVVTMGIGLPVLGDASLIAAGTLAGEGRLNVGVVLATATVAGMLGSLVGYEPGIRRGRWLLEHPGRLEKMLLKLLAKGDHAVAHNNFGEQGILSAEACLAAGLLPWRGVSAERRAADGPW